MCCFIQYIVLYASFCAPYTLSPREWLIRRRLEAARELIRKGGRKVSDICFEVGFKNLSHFSKIYKETYGIPPTEDTQPGISLA